jgi:hypothetical protein
VPDSNAAFLFITRGGNMGLIETTDRVTQTANLSGTAARPSRGVGFHKGVRFNLTLRSGWIQIVEALPQRLPNVYRRRTRAD